MVALGFIVFGAFFLISKTGSRSGGRSGLRGGVAMLARAAILSCRQPFFTALDTVSNILIRLIPVGTVGGSVSRLSNSKTIDGTQLAGCAFIRTHLAPADCAITNKHCLTGTIAGGNATHAGLLWPPSRSAPCS